MINLRFFKSNEFRRWPKLNEINHPTPMDCYIISIIYNGEEVKLTAN